LSQGESDSLSEGSTAKNKKVLIRVTVSCVQSKGLRERWLLDGAPPAGQDQNHQTTNRTSRKVTSPNKQTNKQTNKQEEQRIKQIQYFSCKVVESVKLTQTHLSLTLVHEMNGEDGVHLLSSSEVDELIHKADEALMTSQTDTTVTSFPTSEFQEEAEPELPQPEPPQVSLEITGLEAKPHAGPSAAEASAENPVTMVFMGYQSVEDEAETQKVLGLQGTVTATLVMIHDAEDTTSPGGGGGKDQVDAAMPAVFEAAEKLEGRVVEMKKEKQPCNCCSIM
uniref:Paralemmin-1 n=1 Tax=Scophthalmus maximus TaxID=52904 RepID=A0A8D3DDQ8_SCOMX